MTLIKELIKIPKQIQRGDFVLRLSEGVNRPEETLRQYVVTPELTACFGSVHQGSGVFDSPLVGKKVGKKVSGTENTR